MIDIYHIILSQVVKWQQEINFLITDLFDRLDNGEQMMFFYILGVSFLYGLIHALGPGHGKMVIASYFLVKESKRIEAFKAGFLTSIIHTISALSITAILYLFFEHTITKYFQSINTNMYKISAIFIILIALFLLYETIKDRNEEERLERVNSKNIMTIALSIGIVPCPGVMTIVFFAMILGYFTLGLFSAITMSLGMGITISIAAILSSNIKNSSYANRYKRFIEIISYFGIAVLFLLGVSLLV